MNAHFNFHPIRKYSTDFKSLLFCQWGDISNEDKFCICVCGPEFHFNSHFDTHWENDRDRKWEGERERERNGQLQQQVLQQFFVSFDFNSCCDFHSTIVLNNYLSGICFVQGVFIYKYNRSKFPHKIDWKNTCKWQFENNLEVFSVCSGRKTVIILHLNNTDESNSVSLKKWKCNKLYINDSISSFSFWSHHNLLLYTQNVYVSLWQLAHSYSRWCVTAPMVK